MNRESAGKWEGTELLLLVVDFPRVSKKKGE